MLCIMGQYTIFLLYIAFLVIFYIYDLFLGKQINPIAVDKRRDYITVLLLLSNIMFGLIIFYTNYINYNILSTVLLMFYVIPSVIVIICDAAEVPLYLNDYMYKEQDSRH